MLEPFEINFLQTSINILPMGNVKGQLTKRKEFVLRDS
jgi:hypothetical protein